MDTHVCTLSPHILANHPHSPVSPGNGHDIICTENHVGKGSMQHRFNINPVGLGREVNGFNAASLPARNVSDNELPPLSLASNFY
jgi:hypothetical protein